MSFLLFTYYIKWLGENQLCGDTLTLALYLQGLEFWSLVYVVEIFSLQLLVDLEGLIISSTILQHLRCPFRFYLVFLFDPFLNNIIKISYLFEESKEIGKL